MALHLRRWPLAKLLEFLAIQEQDRNGLKNKSCTTWQILKNSLAKLMPGRVTDLFYLIEVDYVDEYWSDEYLAYYASTFSPPSKRCTRIIVYRRGGSTATESENGLPSQTPAGFISFRPWLSLIPHEDPNLEIPHLSIDPYMGGTYICGAMWDVTTLNSDWHVPCAVSKQLHFGGQESTLLGIPESQQDTKVGACMQAAMLCANQIMKVKFGKARHLTSQITTLAKSTLPLGRVIPGHDDRTNGLTDAQTLNAFVAMGLDPLYFSWPLKESKELKDESSLVPFSTGSKLSKVCERQWAALFSYVSSRIPVILTGDLDDYLTEEHGKMDEYHAVLAVGFVGSQEIGAENCNPYLRDFKYLIVNDDQHGTLIPCSIPSWNNLELHYPYCQRKMSLQSMFVPMPGRVYTTAQAAMDNINAHVEFADKVLLTDPDFASLLLSTLKQQGVNLLTSRRRLRLCLSYEYKAVVARKLRGSQFAEVIGSLDCPRFIWVCEFLGETGKFTKQAFGTMVLDATGDYGRAVLLQHWGGGLVVPWRKLDELFTYESCLDELR